ncbi:MAG: hypothetical protein R6V59_05415, partial [Dehalococcoidia bacterium]
PVRLYQFPIDPIPLSPALSATPHVHEQIIATLQRPVFGTTWHFRQMLRSQLASTTPGLNVEKFPKKYLLPQTAEVGLVSIYRAVKKAGKTLVIDLYTAFVLDKLRSIPSKSIPQFDWREIRVLYVYSHARKLAEHDKTLLYKYKRAKIEWEEIEATPQNIVILSKDNSYFRRIMLPKLGVSSGTKAIYSMWRGYLERTDLAQFLGCNNIGLLEIHTSGHAYVEDLKKLAEVLAPRFVVPIHTFYPDQYGSICDNIVQLDDGQTYYLRNDS